MTAMFALTVMAAPTSVPMFIAILAISIVTVAICAVVGVKSLFAELRKEEQEEDEQRLQVLLSTHPTRRRIVYVAQAIGLMLILLAAGVVAAPMVPPTQLTIVPCSDWGCILDQLFW